MRRLASFVAILILLSAAGPVLACVSGDTATPVENACCAAMHGDCGAMAASGCCRTEVKTGAHPQLAASGPGLTHGLIRIGWLTPAAPAFGDPSLAAANTPREHSPPGLLAAKSTTLRI